MKSAMLYAATALAGVIAIGTAAPAAAAPIVGLYNTGVNNAGTVLSSGTDSHYALNGSGTASLYNNPAYIQASDATWIAANAAGGYTVNPNTYTLNFSLAGLNASTATLSGRFAADNAGQVFLNGLLLASTATFGAFTSFSANSGFLAGNNTLSFVITDYGAPSAFIVSGLTGTATATAAVPEPATWGMMVIGFGALGATMRRKRTAVSFA